MAKKILVIGHRGAMGHETENTTASVAKAINMGVDLIEVDVFVIRTGEVVVFHDETLERLAGIDRKVIDFTWEQLSEVRLYGGHSIPLLREIIKVVNGRVPINIELKGKGTAQAVHTVVREYIRHCGRKPADFLISSFLWEELLVYRALDAVIPIGVLTEGDPLEALEFAESVQAVSINPWWQNLTLEKTQLIQKKGFKVYTYTVNEPEDLKYVKELGVDGVFCNFPERLTDV